MRPPLPEIERRLKTLADQGVLVPRTENNQYLKVSYRGADKEVSCKWNVKIYTSGSLVCNDDPTLDDLLEGRLKPPDPSKVLLQVDDAGVGFPLCGALVGVSDGQRLVTGLVSVSLFKAGRYETKEWVQRYADQGWKIIEQNFRATPDTHRIEICTGYINTKLKDLLRLKGFDTRVTEIKGALQDQLEEHFRWHVNQAAGCDLAYDPKAAGNPAVIARKYHATVAWARKNKPELLKTGWEALRGV